MNKQNNYSDDSVQVLEGLEAVRKRPGMYIGSTDKRGLHHLDMKLSITPSMGEVLNGYGNEIDVTINKDGSISIEDGCGMPTGIHKSGKPTV